MDKISNSYKEVVQNNIVEEKDFNLGKIKFDDKILHRSRLLRYFNEEIDPKVGITSFQCRKVAFNLGLSGLAFKEMTKFVYSLYTAYDKKTYTIQHTTCLLYTSPSPRDKRQCRMPSSA